MQLTTESHINSRTRHTHFPLGWAFSFFVVDVRSCFLKANKFFLPRMLRHPRWTQEAVVIVEKNTERVRPESRQTAPNCGGSGGRPTISVISAVDPPAASRTKEQLDVEADATGDCEGQSGGGAAKEAAGRGDGILRGRRRRRRKCGWEWFR